MKIQLTLEELARKLARPSEILELKGGQGEAEAFLREVRVLCHPDRYAGAPARAETANSLRKLAESLAAQAGRGATLRSPKRLYTLGPRIAAGDVADVHMAQADHNDYILKISRVKGGERLLEAEDGALKAMLGHIGSTEYDHFLPTICESFPFQDQFARRANVLLFRPGFYTLEEVHNKHPALEGRALTWIFKRLLSVLGFAHLCGIVHGAINPAHVQVHPEGHGLQLIGWGQSTKIGGRVIHACLKYNYYPQEVIKKQHVSPSTDIYMAAKCMLYLAGGDPLATAPFPPSVPPPLARFFQACLLEGKAMRPDDAWKLHEELDRMLQSVYGKAKFHPLQMS